MTTRMKQEYLTYLESHTSNVVKGYTWFETYLPNAFSRETFELAAENINTHDSSKYTDEEFIPYANYFYGERTSEVEKDFNYAWLHHIHNNPHHWQYWMLQHDDEGLEILDMPDEYILEMICDHWAFSWKSGNLYEVFDWYGEHKTGIKFSDYTRTTYEHVLKLLKDKLDELQ